MVLTQEDAQIVGQDAQTDFTILVVIRPGPQGRSQITLEHAEDGFDLPSLAIEVLGESRLHQPTVVPRHSQRLAVVSRAAPLCCRDDTANAELVPAEPMESFRLVSGIPQKTPERLMSEGLVQRLLGLHGIDPGTTIDHDPKDQVVGRIADR